MSELVKLNSGNELTTEGDLRMLVAVKNADDTICELDFATDAMGSRGGNFRSMHR